jgi:hypothetical protein
MDETPAQTFSPATYNYGRRGMRFLHTSTAALLALLVVACTSTAGDVEETAERIPATDEATTEAAPTTATPAVIEAAEPTLGPTSTVAPIRAAPGLDDVDPCSLITVEEFETATGISIFQEPTAHPGRRDSGAVQTRCIYERLTEVIVYLPGPEENLAATFAETVPQDNPVEGLGESAFYHGIRLYILTPNAWLMILMPDTEGHLEKIITLGEIAVSRLEGNTPTVSVPTAELFFQPCDALAIEDVAAISGVEDVTPRNDSIVGEDAGAFDVCWYEAAGGRAALFQLLANGSAQQSQAYYEAGLSRAASPELVSNMGLATFVTLEDGSARVVVLRARDVIEVYAEFGPEADNRMIAIALAELAVVAFPEP